MTFVTFEGGEGTGKTTQVERLRVRLESMGYSVLVTREPGGTTGAEAIRDVLLSGSVRQFGFNSDIDTILFGAARRDHIELVIRPALSSGMVVLCDRFMDSTRAYQGGAGVDMDFLLSLERLVTSDARPDLTLVFDVPPEIGLRRALSGGSADRYESDDLSSHHIRRRIFLDIASDEPERCVVIDASCSLDEVSFSVDSIIDSRLGC